MQYGNLPEVEMSHYSLINLLQTVPSAGSSSEPSLCYATCKELAVCVCVCLSVFLPLPALPLAFHSNCHSPPFPQVQGELQEIILLIKLWERIQKP